MDKFELIRYGLKKWKMITEGPTFQERKCEKSWTTDNCYACFATHICAKKVRTHIYILYRRFWLLSFDFFLECSDWGSNRNFWNKIHRAAQDRRKSFGEFYFFFFLTKSFPVKYFCRGEVWNTLDVLWWTLVTSLVRTLYLSR